MIAPLSPSRQDTDYLASWRTPQTAMPELGAVVSQGQAVVSASNQDDVQMYQKTSNDMQIGPSLRNSYARACVSSIHRLPRTRGSNRVWLCLEGGCFFVCVCLTVRFDLRMSSRSSRASFHSSPVPVLQDWITLS